jgi:hypothetical protein
LKTLLSTTIVFQFLSAAAMLSMPAGDAMSAPLSCRMQKLLVASSAMRRDVGAPKSNVKATLASGGDLTKAEVQEVVDLVYGELKRMPPESAGEVAFERCAAGMPMAGEAVPVEDAKTAKLNCYDIGYRYGVTATRAMRGLPTNAAWDFASPKRCHNAPSHDAGILAGTKAASK